MIFRCFFNPPKRWFTFFLYEEMVFDHSTARRNLEHGLVKTLLLVHGVIVFLGVWCSCWWGIRLNQNNQGRLSHVPENVVTVMEQITNYELLRGPG